jgi:hypothetical protein
MPPCVHACRCASARRARAGRSTPHVCCALSHGNPSVPQECRKAQTVASCDSQGALFSRFVRVLACAGFVVARAAVVAANCCFVWAGPQGAHPSATTAASSDTSHASARRRTVGPSATTARQAGPCRRRLHACMHVCVCMHMRRSIYRSIISLRALPAVHNGAARSRDSVLVVGHPHVWLAFLPPLPTRTSERSSPLPSVIFRAGVPAIRTRGLCPTGGLSPSVRICVAGVRPHFGELPQRSRARERDRSPQHQLSSTPAFSLATGSGATQVRSGA